MFPRVKKKMWWRDIGRQEERVSRSSRTVEALESQKQIHQNHARSQTTQGQFACMSLNGNTEVGRYASRNEDGESTTRDSEDIPQYLTEVVSILLHDALSSRVTLTCFSLFRLLALNFCLL